MRMHVTDLMLYESARVRCCYPSVICLFRVSQPPCAHLTCYQFTRAPPYIRCFGIRVCRSQSILSGNCVLALQQQLRSPSTCDAQLRLSATIGIHEMNFLNFLSFAATANWFQFFFSRFGKRRCDAGDILSYF